MKWNKTKPLIDENLQVDLYFNESPARDTMQALAAIRLPKMKSIWISGIPRDQNQIISKFLENSIPISVELLGLGFYFDDFVRGKEYIEPINKAVKRVTEKLLLYKFELDNKDLERIFIDSAHLSKLMIFQWKIFDSDNETPLSTVPKYDFTTFKECKIQEISFYGCGTISSNSWASHPEKLWSILEAISDSKLKYSLKKLDMRNWGLKNEEIASKLNSFGMNNLELMTE
jgi:hypothetical protein